MKGGQAGLSLFLDYFYLNYLPPAAQAHHRKL